MVSCCVASHSIEFKCIFVLLSGVDENYGLVDNWANNLLQKLLPILSHDDIEEDTAR